MKRRCINNFRTAVINLIRRGAKSINFEAPDENTAVIALEMCNNRKHRETNETIHGKCAKSRQNSVTSDKTRKKKKNDFATFRSEKYTTLLMSFCAS